MREHSTAPIPMDYETAQQVIQQKIDRYEVAEEQLRPAYEEANLQLRESADGVEELRRRLVMCVRVANEAPTKEELAEHQWQLKELRSRLDRAEAKHRALSNELDPIRTHYATLRHEREILERQLGNRRPWQNVDFPAPGGRGKGPDPDMHYEVKTIYEGEGTIG